MKGHPAQPPEIWAYSNWGRYWTIGKPDDRQAERYVRGGLVDPLVEAMRELMALSGPTTSGRAREVAREALEAYLKERR